MPKRLNLSELILGPLLLGPLMIGCLALATTQWAFADAACEKKIAATGMIFLKSDPKTVCDANPSADAQDCMVNLLKAGKGKLRNVDFVEVFGLCQVDPSQEIQDCFKKNLNKDFNDPAYKGAQIVGDRCLMDRKKYTVKFLHKPTPPRKKKASDTVKKAEIPSSQSPAPAIPSATH